MAPKPFDPLRLDVEAFARAGAGLAGAWPLAELPRLASLLADSTASVSWRADGERRRAAGGDMQTWLRLRAAARLSLTCQRCLAPLEELLELDRRLRFAADEAEAAALDAEIEEDVLALGGSLDLRALVEDELLLALPLVPRHDRCPRPIELPADGQAAEPPTQPFAALAALKRAGRA